MRYLIFILILLVSLNRNQSLNAQTRSFPRDTSFTVEGTFEKEKKKFSHIEIAHVNTQHITIETEIEYKKIPNRSLTVDVFRPQLNQKNIGIILIHGGGWRTGDKKHMHQLSRALSEKGYTCFAVEYQLSLEAKYPAAVEDIQDAIFWVKENSKKYNLHPDNIVCLGTSSGGQLASLVGALNSPNVMGIINIDGLLSFIHPDAEEGTMAAQWLGGDSIQSAENWKEASALSHISEKSAPMLFITSGYKRFSAGKNDVMAKYKQWNIPFDELHFSSAPHTFWYFHPWFIPTVDKINEFIAALIKK
jgi:acetyl esterase/lipase